MKIKAARRIEPVPSRCIEVNSRDRLFAAGGDSGASVLSRGIVGESGGVPTIASPLLKAVFNLETGECLTNDELSVETYPVRVVDGIIQVGLDF